MKKKHTFYHSWRNADQKKIRIGYLSPYFCFHGMMQLGIVFLCNYDKAKFEAFVYMYGKEDEVSGFLEGRVQGWRNIGNCTADEAAKRIYEDRIDILVDISGNAEGRAIPILERKPAPIQIAGIGYCESTKSPFVDYFLGDVFLDDDETEKAFREELLILPQSHLCYTPACRSGAVVKPACYLGETVTFAGIGSLAKIKGAVLSAWAEILGQVQEARLVFWAEDSGSEKQRRKTIRQMEAAGIDLARVEVRDMPESFLVDFSGIDIVLDAGSCWNGGLFCDALYMGVPVVAWNGASHRDRFGWSVLKNAGLGDLSANTGEEYVRRAVMLARDKELLAALRQNLRGIIEKSPLMDGKNYMESLEQGCQMAWEQFVSSQRIPSTQDVENLVAVMDELIEAGERGQVFAVAERIIAAKPQSMKTKLKLFAIYLTKGTEESLEMAVPLFSGDTIYGKYLRARTCFAKKNWAKAKQLCEELLEQGGVPYPWGSAAPHLLAKIYECLGDAQKTAKCYRLASEFGNVEDRKERLISYSSYLLSLQYTSQSPDFLYRESARFGDFFEGIAPFSHRRRSRRKKLRIGYLSPDFRQHVVACFIQAFFFAADRERFEIYGYAKCKEDDFSQRLRGMTDGWRNVLNCSAEETARLIQKDEIDILVELAGHTADNALSVIPFHPALIQICGVGYFSTTGLPSMDYFLVDEHTAMEGEEAFFVEKLLRLPHSHFCYTPIWDVPEIDSALPLEKNGFITFGSMNNVNKISDDVVAAWGKIMAELPDAHLFLKYGYLDDPTRYEREMKRLEEVGIASSRVTMEGFTSHHLKKYGCIDIALDTFPYPGGGTTCDALYMGVPVVSLAGNSNHERFGLSILANLGLDEELCARTVEGYVECAVRLARNEERLRELHVSLRERMEKSHVMNQQLYMKDLEAAYEEIWRKYEEGK